MTTESDKICKQTICALDAIDTYAEMYYDEEQECYLIKTENTHKTKAILDAIFIFVFEAKKFQGYVCGNEVF